MLLKTKVLREYFGNKSVSLKCFTPWDGSYALRGINVTHLVVLSFDIQIF